MLKTISAALLAVSVIAAPALAASSTGQAPASKTAQAPAAKTTQAKPSVMNANAKMDRHHGRHYAKHHRSHNKMTSLKTHKVSSKPAAPAAKRG